MITVQERDKASYVTRFFCLGLDIKQEMQQDSSAQVVVFDEEEAYVPRFSSTLGLMVTLSSLSLSPPLELIR